MKLKKIFNKFTSLLHRNHLRSGCDKISDDFVAGIELQLSGLHEVLQRLGAKAGADLKGDIDEMESRITDLSRLLHHEQVAEPVEPLNNSGISGAVGDREDKLAAEYLGKVDMIIAENIHDVNFGVDTIVRKMLVSRTHFYTRFKELSGQSIGSYIIDYRLRRAKEMLAGCEMPINEIASRLGFGTQRYFSTFFKEKTGKSPSSFRQELQRHRVT